MLGRLSGVPCLRVVTIWCLNAGLEPCSTPDEGQQAVLVLWGRRGQLPLLHQGARARRGFCVARTELGKANAGMGSCFGLCAGH